MSSSILTVVLGDEGDARLWEALRAVIIQSAGRVVDRSWGVGGSQEIQNWQVDFDGLTVRVESETYIGVSITGETALVERIKNLTEERLKDV